MKSPTEMKAIVDRSVVDPAGSTPAAPKPVPVDPPKLTTVGELRAELEDLLGLDDATLVYFGDGQLSFNRVVNRRPNQAPALMQVEFNEVYVVTPDPTGG
jgi:hypothetical protein